MTIETWTQDRVEQLRSFVNAGLSCSQIAGQIGVTRNAVIGKIHRLGLGPGRRPAAVPARARPPRDRPSRGTPREVLRVIFAKPPCLPDEPEVAVAQPAGVESAQPCSLLDLRHDTCRWPINSPGDRDFAFCGNDAIRGFSYCAGHARMAYRRPARRRA